MEVKVYRALCRVLLSSSSSSSSVAHVHGGARRRKRQQFSDGWIILVYLWSVVNDRSVCWACAPRNWPAALLDARTLPSNATMSRRLRSVGVSQLLEWLLATLTDALPVPLVKTIDSKPMTVGAYSRDTDARRGRISERIFARGYRLHAICHGRAVRTWTIASLNDADAKVGPQLLSRLKGGGGGGGGGGYVVGDNAYDTNECHRAATEANHQLIAPPRRENRYVRDAKHNRPERLRALDLLASPMELACRQPNRFGIELYNLRAASESCFGELSLNGLNYLPAWVRGPRRVALWTAGKLALHAQRCVNRHNLRR